MSRLLVILFAVWLFLGSLLLIVLPKASFSETENRALAQWQAPTLQALADGSFSRRIADLCADHLPFRDEWIALKAKAEQLLGKGENNGILFADGGFLMPKGEYESLATAEKNLTALKSFVQKTGAALLTVPRHIDILPDYLPDGYDTTRAEQLPDLLADAEVPSLTESFSGREDVLYRTDHHQTTEGAYLAYCQLGEILGYTPKEESYFEKQTVRTDFLGSSHSKAGIADAEADAITLWRYKTDAEYTVTNLDTGEQAHGFYRTEALDKKDGYQIFLGGNYARLHICEDDTEKPKLLLIKDSQANCLIPFLAIHFDLTVLDLRYTPGIPGELSQWEEYDRILIFQGADTLATDAALQKLGSDS